MSQKQHVRLFIWPTAPTPNSATCQNCQQIVHRVSAQIEPTLNCDQSYQFDCLPVTDSTSHL